MKKEININKRKIGPGYPVYIVAEISANHNQDREHALKLIEAVKKAGADAVKVQTYTPDTITIDCDNEYFRIGEGTIWEGNNLYSLYKEAYMPWEWQKELKLRTEELGMDFFSTPFDITAVEFLMDLDVPVFKIASFEIVDIPLIRAIAGTGKPIILSTGMASLSEIDEALRAIEEAGGDEVVLLKCTSAYPAPPEEMNLRTIPDLAHKYKVPVGLSDHSMGLVTPVAAVALGASVIEKHFTLSREITGPDSAFSMEPGEFKSMVKAIRDTEKSMGRISYEKTEKERFSANFRKSLFIVKDMKAGDIFSGVNVRSIRPAFGLHTKHIDDILGCRAARDIKKGTPLSWDLVKEKNRR